MKIFTFSFLLLFFYAISLHAQITQEQANAIVLQHIQNEITPPYVLYVSTHAPSEGIVITTHNKEIIKAKYACWAYYLNEFPDVNTPCQHRYLFVKADDGNLLEIVTSNDFIPDLTDWTLVPLRVIEKETNNILIYPNPTTGELRMESGEWRMENVEIFDISGRKQSYALTVLRSYCLIDISHLPTGIYFVKIKTETGSQIQKIIKQ
jgi:hypothetical protein